MHSGARWRLCCVVAVAAACGDHTTEPAGESPTAALAVAVPQSLALSPASVAVLPGTAAQYLATVAVGGSATPCTVTMEMMTTLPPGITASFDNSPFTATNQSFTSTLTLSTAPAVAPGNYTFLIRARRGADCEPAPSSPTVTGLLVVIGPAAKVAFGQHPTTSVAGQPIAPAVTARVLDAGNNVVPNSSAAITVALGSNPSGGALAGTLTRAAVNGVAVFPDLSVDRFGTSYTLTAASPGLTGGASVSFTVFWATPARLGFVQQPSGGGPGTPWSVQPRVAIQDASGNTVTGGPGSGAAVTLALVPGTGTPGAVLGCAANPVFAVNGVASFSGCRIDLPGSGYQLRAVTGALTPALSDPVDIAQLNRPPLVAAGGPYTVAEGAELLLSPSVSDPDGDPLTYRWTVATPGMDAGGHCMFADAAERNARLRCTDDSGNAPAAGFTLALEVSDGKAPPVVGTSELHVSNAGPVLDELTLPGGAPLPATLVLGQSLDLWGNLSDRGANDTHLAEVDCGEGYGALSPVGTRFARSCTFGAAGPKTVRVRVTDDDGAAAVRSHAFIVGYAVEGFFEPVASAHALTPWRAGQTIPLTWRVTDYHGRPVVGLPPVSVKSAAQPCGGGVPSGGKVDPAAGASGVRELGDGRYQFIWKTPAAYAGTCRAVWLEFVPGHATGPLTVVEFKPPR